MVKFAKYLAITLILIDLAFGAYLVGNIRSKSKEINKITNSHTIDFTKEKPVVPLNETTEEHIERQIVKPTVRIIATTGTGTGVVVYQDAKIAYILTARHVVENETAFALYKDEKYYIFERLTLVKSDKNNDLAILSSAPRWVGVAVLPKTHTEVKKHAEAFTYGMILGSDYETILTKGFICILKDIELVGHPRMVTSVPVTLGNSGGGLFSLIGNDYKLIGIVTNVRVHKIGDLKVFIEHISMTTTTENTLKFIEETIKSNK